MERLRRLLAYAFGEFGPLIALLALSAAFGLKVAIAGTLAVIVLDAARRLWQDLSFTRIYLLSSGLALVFGTIDLFSQAPFLLKYEAVITNLATALAFVLGAFGKKPMLQEIAEQRGGSFPDRADVHRFFQLFTLLWAAYFVVKAGLYLWIGAILPLERAIALRSLIGGVSLALMLALSITQGRRLFFLCRRIGILPEVEEKPTIPP